MNSEATKANPPILVIDDEPSILSSLRRTLRQEFDVHTASTGEEGLAIVRGEEIHVILTDQRMPGMSGVDFLSAVKDQSPDAIRLLFTGYADLSSIIQAVNDGNIYRYLVKPWDPDELIATVRGASERYDLVVARRRLTDQLLQANAELEQRVQERTAELERVYSAERKRARDLDILLSAATSFTATLDLGELVERVRAAAKTAVPRAQEVVLTLGDKQLDAASAQVLSAPFLLGNEILGHLELTTGESIVFDEDERRLIKALTATAAAAIKNARIHQTVQRLADTDTLTGCLSRLNFLSRSEREVALALRHGHPLVALMLDLDHLKEINDSAGHALGDQALVEFARSCNAGLRSTDLFGRLGGDEFAAILVETDLTSATHIAQRLCDAASQVSLRNTSGSFQVSASIGVAALGNGCGDVNTLLSRADQALYEAKKAGRGRFCVWTSDTTESVQAQP